MKHIPRFSIYFLIAALIVFVNSACQKKLDILPQQAITPEQISTSANIEALLFGCYKLLQQYPAFGEQFFLASDLLAAKDQINYEGTFADYKDLEQKSTVSSNSVAQDIWANSYKIITLANTVIDRIEIVDPGMRNTIDGEAKFVRAITYFELVNFYALPYSSGSQNSNPAVPLVLQAIYSYDQKTPDPSRASVDAVYKQIINDLEAASLQLPASVTNGRATSFAAKAFLSKVFLSMGKYHEAAIQSNDVIKSLQYSLTASFDKAFNNISNSTEDIFAILQSNQSNAGTIDNGLATFYAPIPTGRGEAQININYLNKFEMTDFRRTFNSKGTSISGISGVYSGKWQLQYKTIPVVRLAEMYLTRGEANYRAGATPIGSTPIEDLNIVRSRSGGSVYSSVKATDFIDERFRELAFEGDRLWTLKRLQLDVDGRPYNDPRLILPIPQREIDVNKNLTQNPGY